MTVKLIYRLSLPSSGPPRTMNSYEPFTGPFQKELRCSDVCVWIPWNFFPHSFLCIYVCMRSAHAPMRSCAGRPAGVWNACIPLHTHVQRVRSPLHSIHLAHKHIRLLSKRAALVLLSRGCKYLVCCINTAAFKECRVRK